MAEQLFTIPVNDAFDEGCECPLCSIYKKLEEDTVFAIPEYQRPYEWSVEKCEELIEDLLKVHQLFGIGKIYFYLLKQIFEVHLDFV